MNTSLNKRIARTIQLGLVLMAVMISTTTKAQVDSDQMGAWYMYFYDLKFKESRLGLQGDVQYRNWDLGGDLEQLLLRSGLTYRPAGADVKLTLGYAHITSGAFGDSDETSAESRVYQEALLPQKLGQRLALTHRFRYEQRFVDGQDFRTRYRYNLFLNVLLNSKEMSPGTMYLALYNELFINGQRQIGQGRSVEIFDRNRHYLALGRMMSDKLRLQLGYMRQTSDGFWKDQLQFSLHHQF